MNFFDAQDKARQASRWLVIVYIVSTVLIVAGVTTVIAGALLASDVRVGPGTIGAVALATALFIFGATLFKTAVLSGGGGKVAKDMGGTLVPTNVQDPLRRRLRNVVEEMAIASGVPVPEIYVLEEESAINAFAAGFSPGDAAVAVTRGTLELLNREELQGVIAHEFSHILNGDMRLNIRMMGVLFGIMVLGLIGRMVLRGSHRTGISHSRRGGGAIMIIGLGFTILGWIGVFFGRLIKAAVSRQREYLADASAVQFTRQTDGIANALKKIGGYSQQSYLQAKDPEEISHMLFAGGIPKLASLFATHPPLADRIQALDPAFRETDYPSVVADYVGDSDVPEHAAGFADASQADMAGDATVDQSIAESIGQPGPEHVEFAQKLRASIPTQLYEAAHSPTGAYLLTLSLVMDASHAERQLSIVEARLGAERAAIVREHFDALGSIGAVYRLPILEIAFPELKQRPAPKLEFLLDLIRELIEVDGDIDLREFCYYRIIARHLDQAIAPAANARRNRARKSAARQAAVDLIAIVADQGHPDPAERQRAYAKGLKAFGDWAESVTPRREGQTVARLDEALDTLGNINAAGRRSLVEAATATIAADGRLTATEAELLRAICATLDCPLPPIISTA